MQCATCGHKNPAGARVCASCGTALDLGGGSAPISSTPGIATGGTIGEGSQAKGTYTPYLSKGVRLQGGTYAIGEVLGQGGFGITYKGGDLSLRRYVAIKEFFPAGCARHNATVHPAGTLSAQDYALVKAKFIEEARTLARFSDPGIVRVYGVFEENNTAYMVMEFLEGTTLSKKISEKGHMDEGEAVGIIEKVGSALQAVHEAGLIHRDLKPDNICLTKEGRVVLIDFGTARSFASGKTVKQTTMLTPGYAPLEQYGQQARFGSYTDIYALAATLYHGLTGQIPPQATDRAAGVELRSPRDLNPRISASVSEAIVWAMQLKAADRPQSVAQFIDALKKGAQPATSSPQSGAVPQGGTVLIDPNQFPPANAPSIPPAWGQPATPSPSMSPLGTYATVHQIAEHQLLTNATPQEVLGAVQRAFQGFGVANATVDGATYRVYGSTGMDLRSWQQNIVAQITQDARGTMVTVSSSPSAGVSDYGRGADETRRLVQMVSATLKTLPAAPTPAYAPPAPSLPYPHGGSPHYVPVQPMPQRKGGDVLALGLIGLFCCAICAPFAWINGNKALADYGDFDPGDRGTVQAGRIMGILGTILWGLYLSISFIGAMVSP